MRLYCYILIILSLGCYKKNDEIEAIPVNDISFKTTLKNHTPGIDYVINKSLEVSKELIIEEGVEIVIEPGCGIMVVEDGSIHFNGSSGKPVVLKSRSSSARWSGISIFSTGSNKIQHAEISGAGSQGENHAAIEVNPLGNIALSHCKIRDNGDASAVMITDNSICDIGEGCEFSNNKFPVQMDLHANLKISGADLKGNQNDVIRVRNHDGSQLQPKKELQIRDAGLPYYFTSSLLIDKQKVIIQGGVSMLFEAGAGIMTVGYMPDLNTTLSINGSSGRSVILGSFHSAETKLWNGVMLSNGYHKISYCIFKKAYTGHKDLGTLFIRGYASVDCKYSTFFADKTFCNITLSGKNITFNPDIFTRNTFNNALLPCVML